jgi:uncharacterized protein (DUF885 family)
MQARHNTHRGLFSTPFYVEGWALYCELQFWNMGFPQSPEDRIGMLFWRMHRCARIIVTLKYHLGQMKPPEMVKFLTDRVGHEPEAARSEIRRFIHYRPLYQCGYMLGGMQLLKLHEELVGEGKPYPRQQLFHDRVLMHGPIPIALLRRSFRDEKISKDLQPTWRFRD